MRANKPNAVAVFDLAYRAGLTLRVVSLIHVSLEALNMRLGPVSLETWGCRVRLVCSERSESRKAWLACLSPSPAIPAMPPSRCFSGWLWPDSALKPGISPCCLLAHCVYKHSRDSLMPPEGVMSHVAKPRPR